MRDGGRRAGGGNRESQGWREKFPWLKLGSESQGGTGSRVGHIVRHALLVTQEGSVSCEAGSDILEYPCREVHLIKMKAVGKKEALPTHSWDGVVDAIE